MAASTGVAIAVAGTGLLAGLAVYRMVSQRRQLTSGRGIGRLELERRNGKFTFDGLLAISRGGEWCRLLLTLTSDEASRMSHGPKFLGRPVALRVGTPYTLTLKGESGGVLHQENGSLEPFVAWMGSRSGETETPLGEKSRGNRRGTVTLLEFLPERAGRYRLSLEIDERAEARRPGSSSSWSVVEAEISVREGVIPFSKTVRYPHRRVRI